MDRGWVGSSITLPPGPGPTPGPAPDHSHIIMSSLKRSGSRLTGPASFKRAKASSASSILRGSTVPASAKKRVELKRVIANTISLNGSMSPLGQLYAFPSLAGGSASNQREGRAVNIKAYELRGTVWYNGNYAGGAIRIITFLWKQGSQGTVPIVSDILDAVGGTIPVIDAPYSVNHAAAYRILQDRVYNCSTMCESTGTGYVPHYQYVRQFGKLNITQTYYDQNDDSHQDNNIYVLVVAGHANGSCQLSGSMTYIDI